MAMRWCGAVQWSACDNIMLLLLLVGKREASGECEERAIDILMERTLHPSMASTLHRNGMQIASAQQRGGTQSRSAIERDLQAARMQAAHGNGMIVHFCMQFAPKLLTLISLAVSQNTSLYLTSPS